MLWAHQGPLAVLLAVLQNKCPEQGTVTGTPALPLVYKERLDWGKWLDRK